MSSKPSTPNASPESIDVNAAFDFEGRQGQSEMNAYTDNRMDIGPVGLPMAPDGSLPQPPLGSGPYETHEEKIKAATDAYHERKRQAHMDGSPAAKPYEKMGLLKLASKLGEAEYHGDKTMEQDIGDILLDRLEVEEEKIKDDTYFREGTPTETLWTNVINIAENKKRKLEEQAGDNSSAVEDDTEKSDDPVDEANTSSPYDWDSQGAFEPFIAEEPGENNTTANNSKEPEAAEESEETEPVSDEAEQQPEDNSEVGQDSSEDKTEELPVEPSEADTEELTNPEKDNIKLEVGRAEQAHIGEDSILDRRDLKLFGVFDGMGGMENGAEASQAAVKAAEEVYESRSDEDEPSDLHEALENMKYALATARQKVSETGGFTTATFAKVERIGDEHVLVYGHAGDSRLYYESGSSGIAEQLTDDQTTKDGTTVYNALAGAWDEAREKTVPFSDPALTEKDEFGFKVLSDGDRIMLCTDGITGDYDPDKPEKIAQVLRPEEIQEAFGIAAAQDVANRLLEISRKHDDKSVLVIDVALLT